MSGLDLALLVFLLCGLLCISGGLRAANRADERERARRPKPQPKPLTLGDYGYVPTAREQWDARETLRRLDPARAMLLDAWVPVSAPLAVLRRDADLLAAERLREVDAELARWADKRREVFAGVDDGTYTREAAVAVLAEAREAAMALRKHRADTDWASEYETVMRPFREEKRPTLRRGSRGTDVAELQRALVASHCPIDINGYFFGTTESAVKMFQRQARLPADGIVGPKTWDALERKRR